MSDAPRRGVVAAGHRATAEAGAAVLDAGGNAFDACVAAGFAAAIAEPGFTSLAGGGFLLARTADGMDALHDFFVDTPGGGLPDGAPEPVFEEVIVRFAAAEQSFHCGPGSIAVPGVLAGYLHVHGELGRLPLADVVAPAVHLATAGVEVSPSQAADIALLGPILTRTPAGRALFAPEGTLVGAGDRLRNPDLGAYLAALAADPTRTFYGGEGGRAFAAQVQAGGGLLTDEDLAAYRVVVREPLRVPYRGRTVLTNPPPTFGGALLGVALRRLERAGPLPPAGSPELAERLVEVMASVDADRADGHPEIAEALLAGLTGAERGPRPEATRGTTHVTVADVDGNVAAMTTSNGECSGDVVEGTGILCNNMLGEEDLHPDGFHAAPSGVRVGSMMAPTFVVDGAGAVVLAMGSGGSKRIRSALLQVLTAVVDHGSDLVTAVEAPRLHWDDDHVELEPGAPAPVVAALEDRWPVNTWPSRSLYFGGVHAAVPPATGAGDPRRGGAVRVV